jgi:hypothetical protein
MKQSREEIGIEALSRAKQGQSVANYAAIFEGFAAKGLSASSIEPRVNVFTYNAWRALGRQVRKGEKGVKVFTFAPVTDKDSGEVVGKRAVSTTVFHISQTDQIQ